MVSRTGRFSSCCWGCWSRRRSAQEVDARAALLASLKAMGGENLKTIEISGAGSSSLIGQQYSVDGRLAAVRGRQLHAGHRLRRQVVARGLHAPAGQLSDVRPRADGGAAHHRDRERQRTPGTCATTCPCRSRARISMAYPVNELRQLELAITPHGFLKAALAAKDATAITHSVRRRVRLRPLAVRPKGDDRVVHASSASTRSSARSTTRISWSSSTRGSRIRSTATWTTRCATREYKDFGGVKFPMLLAHAPGRSAAERGAQLLRVPSHEREAERAGHHDAGA